MRIKLDENIPLAFAHLFSPASNVDNRRERLCLREY